MGQVPIRTCAGCRTRRPQSELLRVVKAPDGTVGPDPRQIDAGARTRGRAPGRGAYVCFDRSCVHEAFRSGRLRRTLRCDDVLPEGLREELLRRAGSGL
jgi:predicted RNA-binding protein YlxR (DUF448 family)